MIFVEPLLPRTLPVPMLPKNAQSPPQSPLTIPEQLLLRIASRVDTAIRYKEAHLGGDYSRWADHLSEEAVSPIMFSHCLWITTSLTETHQGRIFTVPTESTHWHRPAPGSCLHRCNWEAVEACEPGHQQDHREGY